MQHAAPVDPHASTLPPPIYADDEPRCMCEPSTRWDERRFDGTWEDGTIAQATCLECGASLSRLVEL